MIALSLGLLCCGLSVLISVIQVDDALSRQPEAVPLASEGQSSLAVIKILSALEVAGGFILLVISIKSSSAQKKLQRDLDEIYNLLSSEKNTRKEGASTQQLRELVNKVSLDVLESHKKEKAVVDRAVDVVCIVDLDSRFVFVSPASKNAWGYEPAQLIGKPLTELLIGDDSQQKLHSIIGAANSIQQVVFECRLKKQDGTEVDAEWTGHWSASDAGFFCIVHDISEKKRLDRLQREFLAMVTHDLRSPISGMQGVLALMEAGILGRLTNEGQQITSKVRQNCKRLVRLLDDMLELDRADSGKFVLECCNFPLNAAIEQALVDVRAQAAEKQIEIVIPQDQLVCFGDEDRLTQVIANLLGNAIKYAPASSQIVIDAYLEGDSTKVSVTDRGRGIPEDKLRSIFNKFEQVMASDATQKRGVGLGLAICKTIVEEHGGAIGVESTAGEGSTFWFTVPQARPAHALEIGARSAS